MGRLAVAMAVEIGESPVAGSIEGKGPGHCVVEIKAFGDGGKDTILGHEGIDGEPGAGGEALVPEQLQELSSFQSRQEGMRMSRALGAEKLDEGAGIRRSRKIPDDIQFDGSGA